MADRDPTRTGDPRARARAMAEYDALPAPLRLWLAGARLQWSPRSARRAWRRALWRSLGREQAALARMDALEAAALAREGRAEPGGDARGGDGGARGGAG